VTGTGVEAETALADAASSADALNTELDDTTAASAGAGAAARDAGAEAAAGVDQATTGWGAVTAALADYVSKARDIGGDVSRALVGTFSFAENSIGDLAKTGKLDFRDMVMSMIADLAKLAAQRFILGPIANALSGALGGAGGIFANILRTSGVVGAPGPGRMGPRLGLCRCPPHAHRRLGRAAARRGARDHATRRPGALAPGSGRLRPVGRLDRHITINARDAESFRQPRTQVARDIARAVSLGRRGM